MGLVKCIDCGSDVSDRASACPKCGGPIDNPSVPYVAPVSRMPTPQRPTPQSSSPQRFVEGDRVVIIKTGRLMSYDHRRTTWKKAGKMKFAAGREGVCVGENRFILPYGLNKLGVILSDEEVAEYLAPA